MQYYTKSLIIWSSHWNFWFFYRNYLNFLCREFLIKYLFIFISSAGDHRKNCQHWSKKPIFTRSSCTQTSSKCWKSSRPTRNWFLFASTRFRICTSFWLKTDRWASKGHRSCHVISSARSTISTRIESSIGTWNRRTFCSTKTTKRNFATSGWPVTWHWGLRYSHPWRERRFSNLIEF